MEKNAYKITVEQEKKVITILAGELTSQVAVERFIKDYQAKVNSISASSYTLDIDCRKMKVVTPELAESLRPAFELYKSSGFKNVRFIISDSAIQKMQYARIARQVNLVAEFIN